MNKTSNNGNILRRQTRDIKPCTLGEAILGEAILISQKNYISVDISIMALSYRIIFCREFCTMATKMKKLRIRRKITGN